MRAVSTTLTFFAFSFAAIAAYFASNLAVKWVEKVSVSTIEKLIAIEGHEWASVQADGLQVILEGEAPSEAARFKVLTAAGSIVEAARVIDSFSITATVELEAPEFSVEILRNAAGISIIGLIPESDDIAGTLSVVSKIAADLPVTNFLETADYPKPTSWSAAMSFALLALERLDRSKISVTKDRVQIQAIGNSVAEKIKLESELTRRTPINIRAEISINAPRPVITPFTLRFRKDSKSAQFDACSADSDTAAKSILAAAVAAGLTGEKKCRQGLGVPSPMWSDAAVSSISALNKINGGTITMSDADITITALEGTDPALFDLVASQLDADLPEIFSLQKIFPVTEEVIEGQTLVKFTATLTPEGQAQIRGPVRNALALHTLSSFSDATFGKDRVLLATNMRENLPAGWSIRVLASLAALGELESGVIIIEPRSINIKGRTGNKAARTKISQVLLNRLGNETNFKLDVRYLEELDPLASMLNPNECIAEIKRIVTSQKISFEPSSTTLDGASQKTITALAEVFDSCLEAVIEIGGHTDSQGREIMNLNLSQSRADEVLIALRGARVKMKTLTSVGFGESQPIADNETEEGREANRRIVFRLVPPKSIETETPVEFEEKKDEQN